MFGPSASVPLALGKTVVVDPAFSSSLPLHRLASAVGAQCTDDDRRHEQSSPAALRLRLDELSAVMRDPLRGAAHLESPGLQVDVAPLQPERFALT